MGWWYRELGEPWTPIVDDSALDELLVRFRESCSDVRCRAVEELGQLGDVRAVEPLIDALKERRNDSAVTALGELEESA